jgi:hypothetical protein
MFRRLYSHYRMVSNSVGVMTLADQKPIDAASCPSDPLEACKGKSRPVEYMKYHWKTDHSTKDLLFRPIFQIPVDQHPILCAEGEFLFVWPMTGISVYSSEPGNVSY